MSLKKILVGVFLTITIALSINYLFNIDDARIQINKTYKVNGVNETYLSGIDNNNHHITLKKGEFGIEEIEEGDELKVIIFIDKILNVKEVY